ncbi:MAG: hypothetical protein KDA20_02210 [Phycisphaerales bacterium]|nr:hypothetical protein [Phycisphaerales bacterium]
MAWLILEPTSGSDASERASYLIAVALVFVGAFGTGLGLWWAGREFYYRSGAGRRVAVSFSHHRLDPLDFAYARRALEREIEDSRRPRISVRRLPPELVDKDSKRERFLKRYKIDHELRVLVSPVGKSGARYRLDWESGNMQAVDVRLKDAIGQLMDMLGAQSVKARSITELLEQQSRIVYEILLVGLGMTAFVKGNFEEASSFLSSLDDCLGEKWNETHHIRFDVRWTDHLCRTSLAAFPGNDPPGPERLEQLRAITQSTVDRYGRQFPICLAAHSRILFYLGDLDGALAATEAGLSRIERGRPLLLLNRAVLHLFLSNWKKSATAFEEFFATKEINRFNWDDLVGFAECARDHKYDAAVYLLALYWRIKNREGMPIGLYEDADKWVQTDKSKGHLRSILHKAPRLAPKPDDKRGAK